MQLSYEEEQLLKSAFKHVNQGFTNNQTSNDSSHNNGGVLEPTGSSEVFTSEKKTKTKTKGDKLENTNRS